ncbi:uncharacterized protein LOC107483334 [Arachis duranensis]|uniref:Uncharacterized protein LOC107483334 n=1 Tax=Arachis duranensis TaxID=130453 RepID=A0A6P5NI91_ARADU|nr:uncharacterized protein LOC107483334 [Arachis duranensis]
MTSSTVAAATAAAARVAQAPSTAALNAVAPFVVTRALSVVLLSHELPPLPLSRCFFSPRRKAGNGKLVVVDSNDQTKLKHEDKKVLVGSEQGPMQLWNISTKKKIFEFKGWDSPITCCVSSPALDVVAVGCADGSIHVHNIRYDKELVTFTHSTRGSVTALSFCTDGKPLLASGGSSGVISVWNLEKKRLQSVVKEAHDSVITSLHFFANEPVLMSSSADNSIKMSYRSSM